MCRAEEYRGAELSTKPLIRRAQSPLR
jgi:hypothetical protein